MASNKIKEWSQRVSWERFGWKQSSTSLPQSKLWFLPLSYSLENEKLQKKNNRSIIYKVTLYTKQHGSRVEGSKITESKFLHVSRTFRQHFLVYEQLVLHFLSTLLHSQPYVHFVLGSVISLSTNILSNIFCPKVHVHCAYQT
jgi:hypothetical protein